MVEEQNKPHEEVRVARTSEERIASILLDALENFNLYFNIANGIEPEQIGLGDFGGGSIPRGVVTRRASSLVASLNTLKQIIRIARPTIAEVIDLSKEDNDSEVLVAIRKEVIEILHRINHAHKSPTLDDDLILEKEEGYPHTVYVYELTQNFHDVISETEELYEEIYKILFRNGLLTQLNKKAERRTKNETIR